MLRVAIGWVFLGSIVVALFWGFKDSHYWYYAGGAVLGKLIRL